MTESPGIIAVKVTGPDAVSRTRDLVGDTEPVAAADGTIRGDLGTDSYAAADEEGRGLRNLVHASEDQSAAARELKIWF